MSKTSLEAGDAVNVEAEAASTTSTTTTADSKLAGELAKLTRAFEAIVSQLPSQQAAQHIETRRELTQLARRVSEAVKVLADNGDEPPPKFKHDHSAFGILKGKLELDGIPCGDGLEFQNRIRGEW